VYVVESLTRIPALTVYTVTLQLAGLFKDLETSTDSAVTPSLELAKLALVTSKDEDEDIETGKTGTDSSNSTDATLVEEPAATSRVADEFSHDTKSVLGKRDRGDRWKSSPVEPSFETSLTQSTDQPPTPPPLPPRKKPAPSDSVMMFGNLVLCA
jgi:ubiquitin carboxyl-terminal hydrolase 25/28